MLTCTHLKPGQYAVQAWKNGAGETKELLVDTEVPFRFRLSWACLNQSGPFSLYPGYDRILVLLRGGPVRLKSVDFQKKRESLLSPLNPYSFSGDWVTTAEVDAPAEDFNVFLLRHQASAHLYPGVLSLKEELQFPLSSQEHFLFCVAGKVSVSERNTHYQCQLEPGDLLRLSRSTPQELLNLKALGAAHRSSLLWIPTRLGNFAPAK